MNILLKLATVSLIAVLTACQSTAPRQSADPAPPPTQSAAPAPTARQQPAQTQSTAVITLHLAQQRKEPSLIEVNAGGNPLYALPQPVLTQADMARVSPVTAPNGTFLLLEMNEQGISKLNNITQQARGHYLLLSVQGQLVSVAQIGEVIEDGRLLVATQSPEHSQAIIQLMQGKS